MKKIKLTNSKLKSIVDEDDFDFINSFNWQISMWGYALRHETIKGKTKTIRMHRVINQTPDKLYTDHINGNKLDNRKSNLRTVTMSESNQNRRGKKGGKSEYKGVYLKQGKWCANITANKKRKYLGYYNTEKEAAIVYNEAAKEHHGEFAKLNKVTK